MEGKHFDLLLTVLEKAKLNDLFTKVFSQNIKPLIDVILSSQNTFSKEEQLVITRNILASTFIFNQQLCSMLIESNSPIYADSLYDDLCDFFIDRDTAGEVDTEEDETQLKVEFGNALIALSIIKNIHTDARIAHKIRKLMYCAKNNSFTRENISHISPIIKSIIDKKLPDGRNIPHDGYKIISTAYYYKIIKNKNTDDWKDLVIKAEAIPNLSDRGYTLCTIADALPDGIQRLNKSDIIDLALSNIDNIQTYFGRVERYGDIIQMLKRIKELRRK